MAYTSALTLDPVNNRFCRQRIPCEARAMLDEVIRMDMGICNDDGGTNNCSNYSLLHLQSASAGSITRQIR
jgi:hypothetical protein